MRSIRDCSIRTKLILLAAASGGVAVLLCSIGAAIIGTTTLRSAKITELQTQAQMIAFNSTAVLTFGDGEEASQLLDSLRLGPDIVQACLFNPAGDVFATFVRDHDSAEEIVWPSLLRTAHAEFTSDRTIEIFQPVVDDGEVLGTVYVQASMEQLSTQLWGFVQVAAIVSLISFACSLALAAVLQRKVSGPILRLAHAAEKITSEGDYSIRVAADSKDETGKLCRAFNRMIACVEVSGTALSDANTQLELRVRSRTAELETEIVNGEIIRKDLAESRNAAEVANRAKSEFLANMSHEIRTPLNGIIGFCELLLRGADKGDEAVRLDYVNTISSSGKQLTRLINDILDLSKIEANRLDIEILPWAPPELISGILSLFRMHAGEKGLSLELTWNGLIPATIQTDGGRFRQLLTNLLSNAIKFTKVGHVRVTIEVEQESGSPVFVVTVRDTGIGIPADKLESIFKPFIQADSSVTRKFGGTGLGLTICKQLAKALGGDLTVSSIVGAGSVFRVTLDPGSLEGVPMLESPQCDGLSPLPATPELIAGALSELHVLLVEDGLTNQKLISLVLSQAGATVEVAENGLIGVQMATEGRFDIVLMDMQMPVMDGYTATRHLRDAGYTRPIMALTANAMKSDETKCLEAGCSSFLSKPVDIDQLLKTVSEEMAGTLQNHSDSSTSAPRV